MAYISKADRINFKVAFEYGFKIGFEKGVQQARLEERKAFLKRLVGKYYPSLVTYQTIKRIHNASLEEVTLWLNKFYDDQLELSMIA